MARQSALEDPAMIVKDAVTIAHREQVVLESDPYRRLSYTWHTFTRNAPGTSRQ
jgi:hypothetical protein